MLTYVVIENNKLNYFKALKSSFVLIFMAMLIYRIFDQYLTKQIELIIRSQDGIQPTIWIWAGLSLMASIVFPTVTTIISAYALKYNSLKKMTSFFNQHIELSILETMRAWGMSFLWGLLFIIPGLIKMSYYYLTIFIVLFNPDYAAGKVDALQESANVSKHGWIKLNLLVALFYGVIPVIASMVFDEYTVFEKYPLTAIAYTALEAVLILLFNYYVLNMFLKYIEGDSHVAHV